MLKYKFDVHTHTVSSGHAYSTITENAAYASKIGLEMIGVSDHAPQMPGSAGYLYFLNMKVLPEYISGIRVLKGIELNIMNNKGKVDMKNGILKRLDYAIASLHIPCIEPMDMDECTQAIKNTIKNPYVNIIGHPGDPRYPLDIKAVVTCARDNNTLLEVNNSSFAKGSSRQGGESIVMEILEECKRQDMPVILGSDAHFYTYIGGFDNIMPLLEEVNFPDELVINTDLNRFLKFLELKRKLTD
jgi:putative hydrolase NT01CX_1282